MRAVSLLLLALLGLVLAPVLHAEVHAREAELDAEMARLVQRVAQRGPDFDEAFAQLWKLGHRKAPPHSHGPSRGQSHGSGSLLHFALALHEAPPQVELAVPPQVWVAPLSFAPIFVPAQAWRTPERSQGPPSAS